VACIHLQEQPPFPLTANEYETFLDDCKEVAAIAYPRAWKGIDRKWSGSTDVEVAFIEQTLGLKPPATILDWGCGDGRHSVGLARRGFRVVGVDMVPSFIKKARDESKDLIDAPEFIEADCRGLVLDRKFDAGICLYDVVGSHPESKENEKILRSLVNHLAEGAPVLLSVMNAELTQARLRAEFPTHVVRLSTEPDAIQSLEPSHTMETDGDVFKPAYILFDEESDTYYRREQFELGRGLPEEVIVPDKRYTRDQIRSLCAGVGLTVTWCRPVRAGKFGSEVPADKGKEILLLCRKEAGAAVPGGV
jgi:SAM-dependent methyltransferase